METVRFLTDLQDDDLALAGGKGANLAAMIRGSLPVPPGFVVLTTAYRAFVQKSGLAEEIRAVTKVREAGSFEKLEARTLRVREQFLQTDIPDELVETIAGAYEALGSGRVAIRSSATTEDLPESSFAGQHDSFLHIAGVGEVCRSVRRCWASLWNPRAVVYRERHGLNRPDVALAVVVQRMVPADRAGVLFTANPLNHRRDQMLINSSFGLGEAVVSGAVSPDQWVTNWDGRVLRTHIADKEVVVVETESGTAQQPMPESRRQLPSLSDDEVAELVQFGRRTAGHFGSPQDIEWASAEGKLFLVQSRPITSLFPLPEPLPDPKKGLRLYLCASVNAQQMVEPMTPMGIEYWRVLTAGFVRLGTGKLNRDLRWFKTAAGRMFVDVTEMLRSRRNWGKLARALSEKDPITARALLEFQEREGDAIVEKPGGIGFLPHLIPLGLRLGFRAFHSLLAPRQARLKVLHETRVAIDRLEREASELKTIPERLRFLWEELGERGAMIWLTPVAVMYPGLIAENIARESVRSWLGESADFSPVQRALPYNVTTEMGLELCRIADQLKNAGVEPTTSHPAVRDFLDHYGHRAVWEIDAGVARWSEESGYILELLRNSIISPDPLEPLQQFAVHQAKADRQIETLVAEVRQKQGIFQAWWLGWLIRRYRQLAGLREQPKFEGSRMIAIARRLMMEAGQELVTRGCLDEAEDIFFLTLRDVEDAVRGEVCDLRRLVEKSRASYTREMERRAVPRWMTSSGEAILGVAGEDAEGVLSGISVSQGVYEGNVRVVRHPSDAGLESGEVMVCRGTDPAWTPLFLRAGALVMETGGTVSHGAIVAREYGLPAVAGVPEATRRLQNGQRVRVDGAAGQVMLLD